MQCHLKLFNYDGYYIQTHNCCHKHKNNKIQQINTIISIKTLGFITIIVTNLIMSIYRGCLQNKGEVWLVERSVNSVALPSNLTV